MISGRVTMRSDMILDLESRLVSVIDEETIRDVKPNDCGMRDESWYVFRTIDGRSHTYSDHADQLDDHPSEAAAMAYWTDAAEDY